MRLLNEHYRPWRKRVLEYIEQVIARGGQVLHISVHSFTPVLNGMERTVDIGLLFDPSRETERQLCLALRRKFREQAPALRVRFNQPYRGVTDGHATALRRRFDASCYRGIEIELNQGLLHARQEDARQAVELFAGLLRPRNPAAL